MKNPDVINEARKKFHPDILEFIDYCLKNEYPHSYLIGVLHKVQEKYGFLSKDHLQSIAYIMQIPSAKVSGVASFYHFFHLKAKGIHLISVCMGTACFVKGAEKASNKLKEELRVSFGMTTPDNKFTVMETRCLGMCAMAPVIKVDEEIFSKVSMESVAVILEKYKS